MTWIDRHLRNLGQTRVGQRLLAVPLIRRSVDWASQPVVSKRYHIAARLALIFIIVGAVFYQIQRVDALNRHRDAVTSQEIAYNATVRAYDAQKTLYDACLTRVDARVAARDRALAQVDTDLNQNQALRHMLEIVQAGSSSPPDVWAPLFEPIDESTALIVEQQAQLATEYPADELDPSFCMDLLPQPPPVPPLIGDAA